MTTSLKALEEAIHQMRYIKDSDNIELCKEAARKYLSIQKAVEAGRVKIVPVIPTREMSMKGYFDNLSVNAAIYQNMLQSAPEFTGE